MPSTLFIPERFNGPVTSGNGGWVGGALARHLPPGPVSVSLRAPPPLARMLSLHEGDTGLELRDGETLLAQAEPATLKLEIPEPPSVDAAAAAGFAARLGARARVAQAAYALCFGCGIARHDGLGIVPGPVGDRGVVAAAWTPTQDLADDRGEVGTEAVWAALDCPAGIAWSHRMNRYPAMMTARMTAVVDIPLRAGTRYGVMGWPIAQDGRKLHAGTAIFDEGGVIQARSLQLWLLPRT